MDPMPDLDPREAEIVAVLAAARARDRAPATLRARIERERAAHRTARRRPNLRVRVYAGAAIAVAALAAALVLILPSGTPGTPTVAEAAALSLRGAAQPAPAVTSAGPGTRLGAAVDEVYFPDWQSKPGWRAVGQRTDTLAGRRAVTVYYQRGGDQVAYTIVATPPLAEPRARTLQARSLTVRALTSGGRTVVTWRRLGDTCVLVSRTLDAHALAELAAWSAPGVA